MALEQHAIPTEVTGYEFHLVGDWTIKQFAWLAGGIILAIIFWNAALLPSIIRIPLVVTFATSGALIAFVPIQGRPLDRWIIAFIKAIYMPTEFLWLREKKIPAYFQSSPRLIPLENTNKTSKTNVITSSDIVEYISSLNFEQIETEADNLEKQALSHYSSVLSDPSSSAQTQSNTINRQVAYAEEPEFAAQGYQNLDLPDETQQGAILEMIEENPLPSIPATPVVPPPPPVPTAPSKEEFEPEIIEEEKLEEETNPIQINPYSDAEQVAMASQSQPQITPQAAPQITQVETPKSIDVSNLLPPPPNIANLLVGVLVNNHGQPVQGAIVEIRNHLNQPVRALKTNQFGHFSIATPLTPDTYTIVADKEPFSFNPVQITVNNQIITPISMIAQ